MSYTRGAKQSRTEKNKYRDWCGTHIGAEDFITAKVLIKYLVDDWLRSCRHIINIAARRQMSLIVRGSIVGDEHKLNATN